MDKFYIITNSDKDKDFQITNEIVSYLKKNGKKCQVQQAERKLEGAYHYTNPELIPEGTQCILVLGGDGTLLQACLLYTSPGCQRCCLQKNSNAGNQSRDAGVSG